MSILDLRLKLAENGYTPIPCDGKRPTLRAWQTITAPNADEMARWSGPNTGYRCKDVGTLDVDIDHEPASETVADAIRTIYDGHGLLPMRYGRAPKFAVPFRCDVPFPKLNRHFEDMHGKSHKLEFLCDGQQCVAYGRHPDTGKDYEWVAGLGLEEVARDELAEISENEAGALLDFIAEELAREHGFRLVEAPSKGNGAAEVRQRVDAATMLADMRYQGANGTGINDTFVNVIPSRLRAGDHPDSVFEDCVRRAGEEFARQGETWNQRLEEKRVARTVLYYYREFLKEEQPVRGVIPTWLPGEFHRTWLEIDAKGWRPSFGRNAFGFNLRGIPYKDEQGAVVQLQVPSSEPVAPAPTKALPRIAAKPFRLFDPSKLPRRVWLYGKHYQRGIVTATIGPGGGGKSSLMLVELLAMCTGRNLLGEQPDQRCRVWYHNAEDTPDELDRRLAGALQHYGIEQEELLDWFHATSGIDMPIRINAMQGGRLVIDGAITGQIIDTILDRDIAVACFDPLIAHHTAVENATGDMDQVIREFARIANTADCATEIVHHTRKLAPGQEEFSIADSRGAGAIINAVRSARVLNPMSKADAESAQVDDVERLKIFRVDSGKANMAPRSAGRWFRFESAVLPNGEIPGEPGDDIGVATAWTFPGQDSVMVAEVDQMFLRLLDMFTLQGRSVNDASGVNYAPLVFSQEPEAKAAKVGKKGMAEAMRRLFRDKAIRMEEVGSGGRKVRSIVRTRQKG